MHLVELFLTYVRPRNPPSQYLAVRIKLGVSEGKIDQMPQKMEIARINRDRVQLASEDRIGRRVPNVGACVEITFFRIARFLKNILVRLLSTLDVHFLAISLGFLA